jgi:hypothetical protein
MLSDTTLYHTTHLSSLHHITCLHFTRLIFFPYKQVLQLLALSTRSQASAPSTDSDKKKHVHSFLSVQLGDSKIDITVDSLGKSVGAWCLDILKATQKVLDAPSFVAILQELLSHEDPSVRQTALQILSKRLLAMSQGKRPGAEEVSSTSHTTVLYQ